MSKKSYSICVVGGTGAEGSGLALRWAYAGHRVTIGSRDPSKAQEAARELNAILSAEQITGTDSRTGVAGAEIVVLTVPFGAQVTTVSGLKDALAGKILIDVTVPLVPPKVARVQLPESGSAVAAIQAMLGDSVRVVSAFQNVSADHLKDLSHHVDCDVLICGDDPAAREIVVGLAADIGLRGVHAGPIVNSAAAEALTSILIAINMRYKVPGSGIRITGLPTEQPR
jgi:8-hydroxy-5-deazaflavin:NADPH oxidoreductase